MNLTQPGSCELTSWGVTAVLVLTNRCIRVVLNVCRVIFICTASSKQPVVSKIDSSTVLSLPHGNHVCIIIFECVVILRLKNWSNRRNPFFPPAILTTASTTRISLELNSSLRVERTAFNRLNRGTVLYRWCRIKERNLSCKVWCLDCRYYSPFDCMICFCNLAAIFRNNNTELPTTCAIVLLK
jgi:hypothetical protein